MKIYFNFLAKISHGTKPSYDLNSSEIGACLFATFFYLRVLLFYLVLKFLYVHSKLVYKWTAVSQK